MTPPLISSNRDAIYRKITWRILPILLLCYLFAFLDRTNIGFAKLQMMHDLGLSDAAYGFGAGIFFIGYVLFEIPSNLHLVKIGARKTISRIMLLWGLTSSAMIFVDSETMFYVLRFLLGVFEAGFAPGVIFFLSYWFPSSRMAAAMSLFLFGAPVSGIVGGPLSGWVMTVLDKSHGLAGWQWMFLAEGLPCVLLAVVVFFMLDDKPSEANWLSAEEKALVAGEVTRSSTHTSLSQVLTDGRVWMMGLINFCILSGMYTISFWLPTMLKTAGVSSLISIGLYTAVPNALGAVIAVLVARRSDKLRERKWHAAIPLFLSGLTLAIGTVASGQFAVFFLAMCIATVGIWTANSVFWSIPHEYFKGDGAAGAVALINTIGLLGAFASPSIIGLAKTIFGTLDAGLYVMVGLLVAGSILVLVCLMRSASLRIDEGTATA